MIVAAVVMPPFDHSLRVVPAVLLPVVLYVALSPLSALSTSVS